MLGRAARTMRLPDCTAAVQALELDRVAREVGERGLEAVPIDVGERQLRAGVRALAA
jgi:hypothetical protein